MKTRQKILRKGLPDSKEISLGVLGLWRQSLNIREMISLFNLSSESLMKFTLLLEENSCLLMTLKNLRNLKLTDEDCELIRRACKGRLPKYYAGSSFKLARKASELMEHVVCDEEMLMLSGLTIEDSKKDVYIVALRNSSGEVKETCKWFRFCSKLVLMKKFRGFSCSECPRRSTNEVVSVDSWLLKSENPVRLPEKMFY